MTPNLKTRILNPKPGLLTLSKARATKVGPLGLRMDEVMVATTQIVGTITPPRERVPRDIRERVKLKVKVEAKALKVDGAKARARLPKGSTLIRLVIIVA